MSLSLLTNIFENFLEKKVRRMDHQQKNDKTGHRKSKRTRQKNKTGDRKWELNDSPEIPDRGYHQTFPSLL